MHLRRLVLNPVAMLYSAFDAALLCGRGRTGRPPERFGLLLTCSILACICVYGGTARGKVLPQR